MDGNPLGNNIPSTNFGLGPVTNFVIEDFNATNTDIKNHMVGGQLGLRWYKRKSRWLLSSELRAFVFQNFQELESNTQLERVYYQDGKPLQPQPTAPIAEELRDSYLINHSASIFLVNPAGKLHAIFTAPHDPQTMIRDLAAIQASWPAS